MKWIKTIQQFLKRLIALLSRSAWLVRLLDLPYCVGTRSEPGIVLIQIDGLACTQFQKALSDNRAPFIKKLLSGQGYTQKPFYAGLPSSTPAVQGELFYGVRTAVPAFEFIDRKSGRRHAMFYPASARKVAQKLKTKGIPLLSGGSSYSNIYSGGADTTRYCSEKMNLQSLVRSINPLKLAVIILLHTGSVLRIIGYAVLELFLAVYDFLHGILTGKDLIKEIKFVPTRLFVCAVLRELISFRVTTDITRGIPVIAANFVGYDEQAHRRGPGSAFARWTIKGIDDVVKHIHRTAARSECRDYRVVIYSDHGQESVETYPDRFGIPVKQAIRSLFAGQPPLDSPHRSATAAKDRSLEYLYRKVANFFMGKHPVTGRHQQNVSVTLPDDIEITTMGPLGHIYLPDTLLNRDRGTKGTAPGLEQLARKLNRQAHIPLVLFQSGSRILAVNDTGIYDLDRNAAPVLGASHPFLQQAAADLKALCFHPDAGDLVISGWNPQGRPMTFNQENGAHGGPGTEETRGVVLLPPCMKNDLPFLRPMDLRTHIAAYLEKKRSCTAAEPVRINSEKKNRFRVATYNIHSCIHMDGRINPDRTADAIAAYDPDIVALQEVDAGRRRTGFVMQGPYIAERLGLTSHFFPVMENRKKQYGLAILSRYPVHKLEMKHFPGIRSSRPRENRGVMLAAMETPMGIIRFANLHLGLSLRERRIQIDALLEEDGIALPLQQDEPVIICGDFNAGSGSYVYKTMSKHLSDVQLQTSQRKYPKATFLSRWPVIRIDHIFVSRHFRVQQVMVPNNGETRMVSDHLPLYCDLEFRQSGSNTGTEKRSDHV